MKYFVLALFLAIQVYFVLSSRTKLRAPVNVSMTSVNFHNVLCWTPGHGTPAGAQYQIISRVNKKNKMVVQGINKTCSQLELDPVMKHNLSVRVSYNHSTSPKSKPIIFTPFTDTIIGPPKLSVAGCGNCIQINITMPEMDKTANINDLQSFYNGHFKISWKTAEGKQAESANTYDKNYIIRNLVAGTKYCVQVAIMINANNKCKPSPWTCTFTSIVEPSRVPVLLGAVSTLLIVGGVVLMTLMFCLTYTGFICKVANQPRALLLALGQGYILTPERTIPDLASVSSDADGQSKSHNHRNLQPASGGQQGKEEEEDEDEEEEVEGDHAYMNREAELSSDDSSCKNTSKASGASEPNGLGDSGRFSVRSSAEVEEVDGETEMVHGEQNQVSTKADRAEVSLMVDGDQAGCQGLDMGRREHEEEEEEEEENDKLGNINLFSITLGSLERNEEEEEEESTRDSLTDFSKPCDQEPLLPAGLQQTLSSTKAQTPVQLDDQTPLALMQPPQVELRETGYESRHADSRDTFCNYLANRGGEVQPKEEEKEEDDEEFSGYMGRC